jgi:phosphatidylserine/phosphatidylglycerophosphate/cardiolipin synthase-like enzyme
MKMNIIYTRLKNVFVPALACLLCMLPLGAASAGEFRSNPEIGFSPEGTARNLVVQFVQEAKSTLDIMAYEWTAKDITNAVAEAVRRGVKVRLVADYKANVEEDKYGASRRALSYLVSAGVDVRVNRQFPIMHDKSMLADGVNVETGSFNFTAQAEGRNSEQVLVFRNAPQTFKTLREHFQSRFDAAEAYR